MVQKSATGQRDIRQEGLVQSAPRSPYDHRKWGLLVNTAVALEFVALALVLMLAPFPMYRESKKNQNRRELLQSHLVAVVVAVAASSVVDIAVELAAAAIDFE